MDGYSIVSAIGHIHNPENSREKVLVIGRDLARCEESEARTSSKYASRCATPDAQERIPAALSSNRTRRRPRSRSRSLIQRGPETSWSSRDGDRYHHDCPPFREEIENEDEFEDD
jgi:hypothetical protein